MTFWVDFETASECDLTKHGAYNYALHPTTRVLCMAYAYDDGDVQLWKPGEWFPELAGHQIRAHNAAFERLIFWYVLDKKIPLERFYCTASQARANCLPGSLDDIGRALSSKMRKDYRGAELVRKCCCPPFNTDLLPELFDYCKQDVRTMREVSKTMRELSSEELHDYHISERINDRGLLVDLPLCRAAMRYGADETVELEQIVANITNGEIKSVRSPRMREWVLARVGEEAKKLMVVYKDGEKKYSIDKTVRANLLTFAKENPDEIPEDVAEVIGCADDLWASSVAKFGRLASLSDEEDHRLRGAFVFAGASATGRNSSKGAQLQNMVRDCMDNPEETRVAMLRGEVVTPTYGRRVTDVLKRMLRPAIMAAPGNVLVSLDWSGIEARMTPWISGGVHAENTLDVFRAGKDIYIQTAAAMFHKPEDRITKADRMLGKVAVLACGFGGGVGAFASMGRIYGISLSESEAKRMVDLWRRANPWGRKLWRALEDAAKCAMRNKGKLIEAGKISYIKHGEHLWYSLPSGRVLCYPFARFDDDGEISYLKAAFKPAADAKEWPRARLWMGTLTENVVQASAACLLRHALRGMQEAGLKVIASVHDEIIVECNEAEAEEVKNTMQRIMTTPPSWAQNLPLAVDGRIAKRFGK